MIMVREVFIAKPGMASKLAKMFKEWGDVKVMTDMSGVYNKVVMEYEYDSLAEYEEEMKKWMKPKKTGSKKKSPYIDLYMQGKREFYRIW